MKKKKIFHKDTWTCLEFGAGLRTRGLVGILRSFPANCQHRPWVLCSQLSAGLVRPHSAKSHKNWQTEWWPRSSKHNLSSITDATSFDYTVYKFIFRVMWREDSFCTPLLSISNMNFFVFFWYPHFSELSFKCIVLFHPSIICLSLSPLPVV